MITMLNLWRTTYSNGISRSEVRRTPISTVASIMDESFYQPNIQ